MLPLWIFLVLHARASRPFDGTFTVVNKANGRRMFASSEAGLFVVDDSGPIYNDQMWLFSPQGNQSFAIINAANGMRVVAQSTANGEHGFFAISHGPIYQDQRWWLLPQSDGSYVFENVKSGRRIVSHTAGPEDLRFAAVASSAPALAEDMWWIINQERDDTAKFIADLDRERDKVATLVEEIATAKNTSTQLLEQLQKVLQEQHTLSGEAQTCRHEMAMRVSDLEAKRSSNLELTRHLEQHKNDLLRLRNELSSEKHERARLVAEAASDQHLQHRLARELEVSDFEKNRLSSDLKKVEDAKMKLIKEVSTMQSQVKKLSQRLGAATRSDFDSLSKKVQVALLEHVVLSLKRGGSTEMLATLAFAVVLALVVSCVRQHIGLLTEVRGKQKRINILEQELHAEFGDMVCVGDFDGGLGTDFGFRVFNTDINQEAVRLIKVQCPGVKHADVEIELIFNGCEVTIRRQASRGVASVMWKKRFQFKPSDGLFEFREEQMLLEDGFLQLVFRSCAFQNRLVLFPRHFSLADTDTDACWDYAADGDADQGDEAEAWWHDMQGSAVSPSTQPMLGKPNSLVDVDTESTASTTRALG